MEIKVLTEEDYTESIKLSMYAFQYTISEDKIPTRKEMLNSHKILGLWDESNLAAKLHLIPFNIYMFGLKWKMGGVAGVATYPEYRRNGYVKSLMIEAIKQMREDGQIVSMLHPFDIGFYRKYGWEVFTENKKILIDKLNMQFMEPQKGCIKRYTKDTHQSDIENVYSEYGKKYMGMLVRNSTWWKNNIYDEAQIAVYYNEVGQAKGYILYEVKDQKMDVQEFISLNHEARCGLWNFICQHDSMVESVSILTSNYEYLPYVLKQPKVKMEVAPYFMARIIDVQQCLEKVQFNSGTEKVFLHIEDRFAPWNNGSYLIGNGDVKVYKEKQGSSCRQPPQRGIRLDINALTAILFGYKRPIELFEMGYLKGTEEEVNVLDCLFPFTKPYFYDFF